MVVPGSIVQFTPDDRYTHGAFEADADGRTFLMPFLGWALQADDEGQTRVTSVFLNEGTGRACTCDEVENNEDRMAVLLRLIPTEPAGLR